MEIFVKVIRRVYDNQVEVAVGNTVQTVEQICIDNTVVGERCLYVVCRQDVTV